MAGLTKLLHFEKFKVEKNKPVAGFYKCRNDRRSELF